jgi:ABC-type uncharacterized transport system involved in gliding motility auxiliary subunit
MKIGSKLLALGLVAAAVLCANFLAHRAPMRADLTAGKIYTLSPGTRTVLARLNEPITLDFYYSRDTQGLRVADKNFATRVEQMLRAYVRAADGKITLNVVSPEPDTPAEERAQSAGLQPVSAPGTGEPIYLGIVATLADQQKALPSLSPQRESFLEYDLSTLLHSIQQTKKPRLGLLSGLPLQGQPEMLMMQRRGTPAQLVAQEWAKSFALVTIEPNATALPADLAALALIHPQGVSAKLEYALDQFLLSGKPVLLAVDPSSLYFKREGGQSGMMFGGPQPNVSSDLPRLLKAYGVTYDPQKVVGDMELATPIQGPGGAPTSMPIYLTVSGEHISRNAVPTMQLDQLMLIEAGSFAINAAEGREITPLLRTSERAGTLASFTLQYTQPEQIARDLPVGKEALMLAALVRGPFNTAFPDGAPQDPLPASPAAATIPSAAHASGLKTGDSTLILIADTDWLLDDFSVRRDRFLNQEVIEPFNDNLYLGANLMEFLAGAPELIGLRGKSSPQRPFSVVTAMMSRAQDRYNEKLTDLEKRLSEVQTSLSEIQSKSGDGGGLVATPAMLAAIDKFEAEQRAMNRERRAIRRALVEDVNTLENKLLAINLVGPAALVSAFGWWFSRRRKSA